MRTHRRRRGARDGRDDLRVDPRPRVGDVALRGSVVGVHPLELTVVPDAEIELVSGNVGPVHEQMVRAAGARNVWIVGGGDLAGQFADAGLLDEVLVTIAPATLGAGAPLLPRRIELSLEEVDRNGDFVCARFGVVRETQ